MRAAPDVLAHSPAPAGADAGDVLDALASAVVVIDDDRRIGFVNAACESLFKNSRGRLYGRTLGDVLGESDTLSDLCRRCRVEGATLVHREFRVYPIANPSYAVDADVMASPFGHAQVLLELHNTELQQRIERENRLLEQRGIGRTMARQLAHEIKNPLGGLRGAAQLLARRLDDPALTEFTDVIIREADRLVTLVDTMLGPRGPARFEAVNIHRLLDHMRRLLVAEAPAGVRICEDYDPSLPEITLDADRVIQALLNVARNALQAVGQDGTVTLRTRAVTGFAIADERYSLVLRVDIQDSGPGVPEELKEKIFYPLVTGRAEGTGLGLTVAQDLINRHQGLVQLRGDKPTVFSIFLPYVRPTEDAGVTPT